MTDPAPLPAAFAPRHADESRHIVDQLIEERAVRLSRDPFWPLVKATAYPALGYRRAVEVADAMAPLSGRAAMDWSADFLSMKIEAVGIEAVPASGPCVITANHPGGIADGIAVWQALRDRRPDAVFFANRDAIRVCEGLAEFVIPVEWREGHRSRDRTRETLKQAVAAFREDRCVVVFPAGRMAKWDWGRMRLSEHVWMPTAAGLARKFDAPVIPLGVTQRMSLAFYSLGLLHEELRHMTVFHELLAKRGARYRLSFGERLAAADLPADEAKAAARLREISEGLAWEAE
ncbi:glycerol acyltransferase [Glycocaulis profundi]|nr:glycerol acyltransferase [Glycocaulis profundi]